MSSGSRILLADIGGTNARFALADPAADPPLLAHTVQGFPVTDYPSLADTARHYLASTGQADADIRHGVFAVAGRVDGDEARITNHPWVISRRRTRAQLGFERVTLVNDFAAQAMAIPLLRASDVVAVGGATWTPEPAPKNRTYAILGPGTGLGVSALMVRDGRQYPLETEGGHASFPPGTPEELAILDRLSTQFGRVSNERLICGPGLVNIHRARRRAIRAPCAPSTFSARCSARSPATWCSPSVPGTACSSPAAWCRGCCPRCSIPASASASRTRAGSRRPWRACRRWR